MSTRRSHMLVAARSRVTAALVVSMACLSTPTTLAHHSFAAEFDYDSTGTIEGEVIEVLFVNPHVRYFVAVVDSAGNETIWDTQTSSVSALTRYGWVKDSILLGERITLTGNLGRDNTRKLWIREVIKEDGTIIRPVAGGAQPSAEESESTTQ